MINEKEILDLLKEKPRNITELVESLNLNDDTELKVTLVEMLADNKIKYQRAKKQYKFNPNYHPFTTKEIDDTLEKYGSLSFEFFRLLGKDEKKMAEDYLNELIEKKEIIKHSFSDGYRQMITYSKVFETTIIMKKDFSGEEYAFCRVDGYRDFHIIGSLLQDAFDGDTVLIFPYFSYTSDNEAGVLEIKERKHKTIIGTLKSKGKGDSIRYRVKSLEGKFDVVLPIQGDLKGAVPGNVVYCSVEYLPRIQARIINVVGSPSDPGMEITELAYEFGFKTDFSLETIEETSKIEENVKTEELEGRRDFRDLNIITIDGDDSKDFDDAVYLTKDDNMYHLGVYIADVSNYVKENSPLDKDAFARGTSAYLADRVIPMLPHKLSDGICSLNPGVDRLVLACLMDIDFKGKLVNYEIVEGVINSHHRMTYNKVNKILNGDIELQNEYSDIKDMLFNMLDLSKLLRSLREKKGSISFETVEYSYTLNQDGSPKEIIKRERDQAEELIEDFMLMANETVSYHMNIMNLPIVYRIHEKPDQERLHQTFDQIREMNVKVKNIQNDIHPKEIQELLNNIENHPNKEIINNMILRSMAKAKYSSECLGHYGLAMNYYCHFTSPIRRYPDLYTHRMIKKFYLHPSLNIESDVKKYHEIIGEVAAKSSSAEKRSVDLERAVNDMLSAWYMESHIGEVYHGTITSIVKFGMFIEIENGIEGLLEYSSMSGFFEYDDKQKTATLVPRANVGGKQEYLCYHIGDKIDVVVASSDRKTREIDFLRKVDRR